jgi:hypothetical protein
MRRSKLQSYSITSSASSSKSREIVSPRVFAVFTRAQLSIPRLTGRWHLRSKAFTEAPCWGMGCRKR